MQGVHAAKFSNISVLVSSLNREAGVEVDCILGAETL